MTDWLDKIYGGLYGQALGDSFCMPAMLRPEDTWAKFSGWITEFYPGPEDHPFHHGLPAGRVTDDTEQAFALAEAMIADGKVTVEGTAAAIVRWYDHVGGEACPFVGPSTKRAVLAIKHGADLSTTGAQGDTNGASMRISPVGLIHPGDLEGAVRDAHTACIATHNTNVAISGAAAVAGAIAIGMQPGATIDDIVQAGIRAADMAHNMGNPWIGASTSKRIAMAAEIVRKHTPERERLQEVYDVIGTSLAIPESVPAAFGMFVMANGDPKQTAIYCAALSGDADTVGAMACAIAGAWRGAGAFSPETVDVLRKSNPELDFDKVAQGLNKLAQ